MPKHLGKKTKSKSVHVVGLLLKFQRVVADMKAMTASMENLACELSKVQKYGTHGSQKSASK